MASLVSHLEPEPLCTADEHSRPGTSSLPEPMALDRAARLLRAMGDQERLSLLFRLSAGAACVTELAKAEGETLATISQRLRVLRSEDLVTRHREGKHILYALADDHVRELIATVFAHARETKHH
jgi:ArsR family transcriptional regulator, lead/cadmium/zinc/bismuth-responsive transcriptional repressor